MVETKVKVVNKAGLHARPASLLVQEANKFEAEVLLLYKEAEINAKSILGVMSLGAQQGSELIIRAAGRDEEEALKSLSEFFASGLGEGE